MTVLASLLLALNLTGTWFAEQHFRDPYQWIRGAGTPAPRTDTVRLLMYVQKRSGVTIAFIRNPEYNLGAAIGSRRIVVQGGAVRLRREGSPDVVGRYDAPAGTLTFRFQSMPAEYVFRRAPESRPAPYVYRVPAAGADGWKTGSLQAAGIDANAIAELVKAYVYEAAPSLRAPYIQGLLIARHGRLVLDQYFNGFSADRPHDVRSAGKSVTTLLAGRAIQDGAAFTPETRIDSLLARYAPFANGDPRKARITVGDLMSMRSGYACDDNDDRSPGNEDTMQSQKTQPDWYKYTLDLPMASEPGTRAVYCSAGINLLGAIVAASTHTRLSEYFYSRFARPMQFGDYAMWLMPPPVNEAYMAGGDYFRPRDFLKFGELFLEDGRWNGKPVIARSWLQTVAARRTKIEGETGEYGYGWHIYTYTSRGRTIRAIGAGGNGGQLLFVFPQLDMTVMITAANYNQFPVWRAYIEKLVPRILAAVRN